jgi:hypothetical protein
MSILKAKNVQIGNDLVANNNFTLYQPPVPDGTMRIAIGNPDGVKTDIMSWSNTGVITVTSGVFSVTGNTQFEKIDSTPIGQTTPAAGAFTSLLSTANTTIGNTSNDVLTINGSSIVLANTATISGNANFTGTLGGIGLANYLASPSAIGASTANTGSFTTLSSSSTTTVGTNLVFSGTGNRITGDFSNATVANRVMFQTSTANTFADVSILPNGTGTLAQFAAYSNSDPVNASLGALRATDATDVRILSTRNGSGTFLPLTFYTGGSERVRIDTSGNVGIGTSSPGSKLDIGYGSFVNASARISTGSATIGNSVEIDLMQGAFGTTLGWIKSYGTAMGAGFDSGMEVWNNQNSFLRFGTNNSERLRLDASGNLGLGVTPSAWTTGFKAIQISSLSTLYQDSVSNTILGNNSENVGNVNKYITTAGASLYLQNAGQHLWLTAPSGTAGNAISFTQAMTLTAAGNLGIGTASPLNFGGANLQVQNATIGSVVWSNGTFIGQLLASAAAEVTIGSRSNHPLRLGTNDTERARITSAGDLLVGATTAAYGVVARLYTEVIASGTTPFVCVSKFSGDVAAPAVAIYKYDNDSTTSQVFVRFAINNGGVSSGQINGNGANQVAFGSWSDVRLKENITALPNQLANICALKPAEFDYRDGSGHQIGFIAQEMQEVYPDVVGEGENGMLMVTGWSKTEARLVKAIQELHAENQFLRSEIEALKARLP